MPKTIFDFESKFTINSILNKKPEKGPVNITPPLPKPLSLIKNKTKAFQKYSLYLLSRFNSK